MLFFCFIFLSWVCPIGDFLWASFWLPHPSSSVHHLPSPGEISWSLLKAGNGQWGQPSMCQVLEQTLANDQDLENWSSVTSPLGVQKSDLTGGKVAGPHYFSRVNFTESPEMPAFPAARKLHSRLQAQPAVGRRQLPGLMWRRSVVLPTNSYQAGTGRSEQLLVRPHMGWHIGRPLGQLQPGKRCWLVSRGAKGRPVGRQLDLWRWRKRSLGTTVTMPEWCHEDTVTQSQTLGQIGQFPLLLLLICFIICDLKKKKLSRPQTFFFFFFDHLLATTYPFFS